MNEELIRGIYDKYFANTGKGDFSQFREDFINDKSLREGIHGKYFSDKGSFAQFESDIMGIEQPEQLDNNVPKEDTVDKPKSSPQPENKPEIDYSEPKPKEENAQKGDNSPEIDSLKDILNTDGAGKYGAAISLTELGNTDPITVETLKEAVKSYDVDETIRQQAINKLEGLGEDIPEIPKMEYKKMIDVGGEKLGDITVTEKKEISLNWDKFSKESPTATIEEEKPLEIYKQDVIHHEEKLAKEDINAILERYENASKKVSDISPTPYNDKTSNEYIDESQKLGALTDSQTDYERVKGEIILHGNALRTYQSKIDVAAKQRHGENWREELSSYEIPFNKLARDLKEYKNGNPKGISKAIAQSKLNQAIKLQEKLDKYYKDPVIKEYYDTRHKQRINDKMFFAFFPDEVEFKKKIAAEQEATDIWWKENEKNGKGFFASLAQRNVGEKITGGAEVFASHLKRWFTEDFAKNVEAAMMRLSDEDKRYKIASDMYSTQLMADYYSAKIPSDMHGNTFESVVEVGEDNPYGLNKGDKIVLDADKNVMMIRDKKGYQRSLTKKKLVKVAEAVDNHKDNLEIDRSYSTGRLFSSNFNSAMDMAVNMAIGWGWGRAGTSLFGNLAGKSVAELATVKGAGEIIGSKILSPSVGFYMGTEASVFGHYLQDEIDKGTVLDGGLDDGVARATARSITNSLLETALSPTEIKLIKGSTAPAKMEKFILEKTKLGEKIRKLAIKSPNIYKAASAAYGTIKTIGSEAQEEGWQGGADMLYDLVYDGTQLKMPDVNTILNTVSGVVMQSGAVALGSSKQRYDAAKNQVASAFMYMNMQDLATYEKTLDNQVILGDITDAEAYRSKLIVRDAKKMLDENKDVSEFTKEKVSGHLVYIAAQKDKLFDINNTEDENAKIEDNIKNAVEQVNAILSENGGTQIEDPLSSTWKRGQTKVDFDNTLWDNNKQELTDFGKKIKSRIENGEQITVLSARENTDENKKFIAEKLGISEDKIKLGLNPEGKAANLNKGDIFYDDNPENIKAAKEKGIEAIQTVNKNKEKGQQSAAVEPTGNFANNGGNKEVAPKAKKQESPKFSETDLENQLSDLQKEKNSKVNPLVKKRDKYQKDLDRIESTKDSVLKDTETHKHLKEVLSKLNRDIKEISDKYNSQIEELKKKKAELQKSDFSEKDTTKQESPEFSEKTNTDIDKQIADLEEKRKEELGEREAKAFVDGNGVKVTVEIRNEPKQKVVKITQEKNGDKTIHYNKYSKELSNDKIYEVENADEYEYSDVKLEQRKGKKADAINKKYDAQIEVLKEKAAKQKKSEISGEETNIKTESKTDNKTKKNTVQEQSKPKEKVPEKSEETPNKAEKKAPKKRELPKPKKEKIDNFLEKYGKKKKGVEKNIAGGIEVKQETDIPDNTKAGKIARMLLPTIQANGFKLVWHKDKFPFGGENDYGAFDSKTNTFHIREGAKGNTALHEIFHPIVAKLIVSDEKLRSKLITELKNSTHRGIAKAREFAKAYDKASQTEEGLTEALANLAYDAMVEYSTKTPKLFAKVIKKILKFFGKNTLLLDELINDNTSIESLGKEIGKALAKGITIKYEAQERKKSNKSQGNEQTEEQIKVEKAKIEEEKQKITEQKAEENRKLTKEQRETKELLENPLPSKIPAKKDKKVIKQLGLKDVKVQPIKKKLRESNNVESVLESVIDKKNSYSRIGGIYYDAKNNNIVVTDSHLLIKVSQQVKGKNRLVFKTDVKDFTGKIEFKKGDVNIETKYNIVFPKYQNVIPTTKPIATIELNLNQLTSIMNKLRGVVRANKVFSSGYSNADPLYVSIETDGQEHIYSADKLLLLLESMYKLGATQPLIEIRDKILSVTSDTKFGNTQGLLMDIVYDKDYNISNILNISTNKAKQNNIVKETSNVKFSKQNIDKNALNKKNSVSLQNEIKKIEDYGKQISQGKAFLERFSQEEHRGINRGGKILSETLTLLEGNERTGGLVGKSVQESELIEQYAKDRGVWFESGELEKKYGEIFRSGGEADVYRKDNGTVVKTSNTFQYQNLRDYLDGFVIHNYLFPNTAQVLIGFEKVNGEIQVIFEQPYVEANRENITKDQAMSQKLRYMNQLGFTKEDANTFVNKDYRIEDLHLQNIFQGEQGEMQVIDSVIRLNTPELGYGGERNVKNEGNDIVPKGFLNEDIKFSKQGKITPEEAVKLNNGNSLDKTPQGKTSKLYEDILQLPEISENKELADRYKARVYSDNFKNWFGDWQNDPENSSKVVDENGEPLLVYHGTKRDFEQFDSKYIGETGTAEGRGFYFTSKQDIARMFSDGKRIIPAYLNIENSLSDNKKTLSKSNIKNIIENLEKKGVDVISNWGDVNSEGFEKVLNTAVDAYFDDINDVEIVNGIYNDTGGDYSVFMTLDKLGYNGSIIKEPTWGNNQNIYIVFNPNNIKSVFNNGDFSQKDDRIKFSKQDPFREEMLKDALEVIQGEDEDFIAEFADRIYDKFGYDFLDEFLNAKNQKNTKISEEKNTPKETKQKAPKIEKDFNSYIQRLLHSENDIPEAIKEYIKTEADRFAPKLTLDDIKYLSDVAVSDVSTLEEINTLFDMLRERIADNVSMRVMTDQNGWEIMALRKLAHRAKYINEYDTAGDIEIYIGNLAYNYGVSIMTLRVFEDIDTLVHVQRNRLMQSDSKKINTPNELTGKTPLEQMRNFIDKILPDENMVEEFKSVLYEKLPELEKKQNRGKRRKKTIKEKSDIAYSNYKRIIDAIQSGDKESNPSYRFSKQSNLEAKKLRAATELMKHALYESKGSIDEALKIYDKIAKTDGLDVDSEKVLKTKQFTEFKENLDESLNKNRKDVLKRLAENVLNPKKRSKTVESRLAKAIRKVKRKEKTTATKTSIYDDIIENELTLNELLNAKDKVVDEMDVTPEEKSVIINEIDDIIEKLTGKAIGKTKVRNQIKDGLKNIGETIAELAGDRLKQRKFKKSLIEDIIETTGISPEEAKKYEKIINDTFDKIIKPEEEKKIKKQLKSFYSENLDFAKKKLEQLTEKRNNSKDVEEKKKILDEMAVLSAAIEKAEKQLKKDLKKSPTLSRLIELVRNGILSEKQFILEFSEMYGLNPLSEEDAKEFKKLISEYDGAIRDYDKKQIAAKIIKFLGSRAENMAAPEKYLSMAQEYIYMNMLSSPYTPFSALGGNLVVNLMNLPADVLLLVRDGISKDPKVFAAYAEGVMDGIKGLWYGKKAVWDVMAKGISNEVIFDIDSKRLASKKVIADYIEKQGKKAKLLMRGNIADKAKAVGLMAMYSIPGIQIVIGRGLIAADVISKSFTVPYLRNRIATMEVLKHLSNENDVNLLEEIHKLIGKTNSLDKAVQEDADESGLKGKELEKYKKERRWQLMPEFTADFINKAANAMSEERAMQGMVYGGIGAYLNPLISLKSRAARNPSLKNQSISVALTLFFPFARLAGISFNLLKGMTLANIWQIKRDAEGKREGKFVKLQRRTHRRVWRKPGELESSVELTEYEKQLNLINSIAPTATLLLTFIALFAPGEDDDGDIAFELRDSNWRITGGSLNWGKQKTIKGYEQYAIQHKENGEWVTVYRYDDNPVGILLAPLGAITDKIITDPKVDSKVKLSNLFPLTFSGATEFVGQFGWFSAMQSVTKFIGAIKGAFKPDEDTDNVKENYLLTQAGRDITNKLLPGGTFGSFLEKIAIETHVKKGVVPKGDQIIGRHTEIISDPLSKSIFTSWWFSKEKLDPYGQPYRPELNNKFVLDYFSNKLIYPNGKETPDYVEELQKFGGKANYIHTWYPQKSYVKTIKGSGGVKTFIIKDLPVPMMRRITTNTALNIKKMGIQYLDKLKEINTAAEMRIAQKKMMKVAKSHAWSEEFLKAVENDPLWKAEKDDFRKKSKSFGLLEDNMYYDQDKIKKYLYENNIIFKEGKLYRKKYN